ncbi:MAG TPA: hypothetical protein VJ870_19845 [Amycolatopsis sp.]|nr:hypothetical protein [Amycolatopsis sp.]
MTTATHGLDRSSGSTTVAELLARHGANADRQHRRAVPEPVDHGHLNGTLPAFEPVERATPRQYRYDQSTVTALLAAQPAEPKSSGTASASKHAGRKIAGLAFVGAVLVGGWALAGAQTQPATGPVNAGPVPAQVPDAPVVVANSATLEAIGAQSAGLAATPVTTATAEIPAAAGNNAPDQGSFRGTLPATSEAQVPGASTSQPAPRTQQAQPAPNWQAYYEAYAENAGGKNSRGGGKDQGNQGDGGKHRKGH